MLVPTVSVFPQPAPGGHLPLPVCVTYADTSQLFYYISFKLPQRWKISKSFTAVGTVFEYELFQAQGGFIYSVLCTVY